MSAHIKKPKKGEGINIDRTPTRRTFLAMSLRNLLDWSSISLVRSSMRWFRAEWDDSSSRLRLVSVESRVSISRMSCTLPEKKK